MRAPRTATQGVSLGWTALWLGLAGSFLHLINLVFHEAGHVLFAPFGSFMMMQKSRDVIGKPSSWRSAGWPIPFSLLVLPDAAIVD
jgi:hypothetical protein